MTALPDDLVAMLTGPNPCFVATVEPDGSPQLTQTWVDSDGGAEHIELLSQRYTGGPYQNYGNSTRPRVIMTIAVDKIVQRPWG